MNYKTQPETKQAPLRLGENFSCDATFYFGRPSLMAEAKLGELFNQMPKQSGGDRRSENFKLPDAGKFENDESEIEDTPKPKLEVAAIFVWKKGL